MINKVVDLVANYKITKATNETLAKIYLELKSIAINEKTIKETIKQIEKWAEKVIIFLTEELKTYKGQFLHEVKVIEEHNKIPNVLRYELAKLISGQTVTPTFKANYIALGNDATEPADTDTTLWNETLRGLFTKRSATNNVAYLDKFFWSTEVAGNTYLEVGTFVDGTATVDTGYLLSRVNIDETMGANETLTLNVTITINSAT